MNLWCLWEYPQELEGGIYVYQDKLVIGANSNAAEFLEYGSE